MAFSRKRIFAVLVTGMLLVSACGYRFAGNGAESGKKRTFFVHLFKNQTLDYGLETLFTNHLISECINTQGFVLTDPGNADILLSGEIIRIHRETVSRTGTHTPTERRVRVIMHLMVKSSTGKRLWETKEMTESEVYNVETSAQKTEINRQNALDAVSRKLSETASIAISEAVLHPPSPISSD